MARRQNEFFFEIAQTIIDELEALGHHGWISTDGFPEQREGLVNVLLPPHEYYALEGIQVEPSWDVLKRTVFICAEQPGSSFFDSDVFLAPRAGAVLDVNRVAIDEFRRRGVPNVHHFPLGWTQRWSAVDPMDDPTWSEDPRDIDVLHLGIFSPKRAKAIARYARHLEPWRCQLLLADDHQSNFEQQQNFAMGDRKWDLLRRSRVLLNVHVAERPYFEWQRIVQAICNGAVVVSEHSTDYAPLIPGEHFLAGRIETLGLLSQDLLHYEEKRVEMAKAAWTFLKHERPFRASVQTLIDAAEEVDRTQPIPAGRLHRFGFVPGSLAKLEALRRVETPERFPSDVCDAGESRLRAALKDVRLDQLANRRARRRQALREKLGSEPRPVEHVLDTRAHATARPRVSVITALYEHADHIAAALDSAAASRGVDLELVITDDGSTDGSGDAVRAWAQAHEDVPLRLLRHPVNRGLGAARNTAVDFARGEFVFVLDADNMVYPRGIARLVRLLEDDAEAAFAYGLLEAFSSDGPEGLRSAFPWQPWRFRKGNYIDAMALIRRDWLRRSGGYVTEARLHGWEDYDLWTRVAEHGLHGAFTPQLIARYRTSRHSMLTVTDISSVQAVSLLIERHPVAMAGVEPPL
jgi:hypothetical protein